MAYNPNNPNGQTTSANSAPVVIASDNAALDVNLNDGTGSIVNSLSAGTNQNGLMVALGATNFTASAMSTTTQLAANATYTSVMEQIYTQPCISVLLICDQPCILSGSQYITSNTSSKVADWSFTIPANTGFMRSFVINGNYNQITIQNLGSVATTTLNANLAYGIIPPTTVSGNAPVSINEINGYPVLTGTVPVNFASYHQDAFNQLVVAERSNDIGCSFSGSGTLSTLLSPVYTGTGAGTWAGGQAQFTTGTTNTSTVYAPSQTTVTYSPGAEIYAYFTAYFTAGVTGTFQRIGLTDKTNGFYVGMEGNTFSASLITNGTITATPQSSFNVDTLTGVQGSKFTRNGVAEAYNPLFQNVFRIRFGWLGSAPVLFEILSPDDIWVIYHIIRVPNLQNTPSIQNPNLPISTWMSSTGSNLTIGTSCWAAGTSSPFVSKGQSSGAYMPTQDAKDSGRTYISFYVDAISGVTTEALVTMNINTAGTVTTATNYTVPAGKILRLTAISATVKTTNTTATYGRVRVRSGTTVAATSGIIMNTDIPSFNGTIASGVGGSVSYDISDGVEIAAGQQIGISQLISQTSSTVSAFVSGFLY